MVRFNRSPHLSEVEITTEQVPVIAKGYIDRNYPKAKITKAWKWTDEKGIPSRLK
jgi:hypothetical protein